MFRGRSAIEIMVVAFTFVIAFVVLVTSVTLSFVKIKDPAADVNTAVSALTSIVASILSALLGLVAGKSEALQSTGKRLGDEKETTVYERPPEHPTSAPTHEQPSEPTHELQWEDTHPDRDQ